MTYGSNGAINSINEAISAGHETLGEIITWSVDGTVDVTYQLIQDALKKSGMETGFARELCPRYAFSRACKQMEENRVIRQIKEDDRTLRFQFTREAMNSVAGLMEYSFETTMDLDKKTGRVSCVNKDLGDKAQELVKEATEARTTSDVTNIVQRMFGKHADLFPVREKGGCYFVPKQHLPFVDKVETFLSQLGGHINRFPILAGSTRGNQSVKTVIAQGLVGLIEEHRKAIQRMGESTMDSTFDNRYQAIELTRYKCEGYAEFLKEQATQVYEAIELAKTELAEAKMKFVEASLVS